MADLLVIVALLGFFALRVAFVRACDRIIGPDASLSVTNGLALFTWSYTARKRGRRLSGFALGTLGAAVASFSADLGGHLVYRLGTGVNESAFDL